MMYSRITHLYKTGKITESGLNIAVSKGWITEEQKLEIIGKTPAEE